MSLIHRAGVLQLVKSRAAAAASLNNGARAFFASEPINKELYSTTIDPVEYVVGDERKILLARLAGDDRYEAKVFRRGPGTKDVPNLIPSMFENRLICCQCEPNAHYNNHMWLRKGSSRRCECGHWFKLVDADPNTLV